jgi:hypothetical protein
MKSQDGSSKTPEKPNYPEWRFVAPQDISEVKHWNNKDWRWCAKCRNGRGQWANAHDTSTHVDGFRFERRSRLHSALRNGSTKSAIDSSGTNRGQSIHFGQTANGTPEPTPETQLNSAQLSLLDALPDCFDDDSQTDD